MKNEKKARKAIDIMKVSRLAWIGTTISFFIPFVGQIITLIAMGKMDRWYADEKKFYDELVEECDKCIEAAKAEKTEETAA